jgi:hypothetical protein
MENPVKFYLKKILHLYLNLCILGTRKTVRSGPFKGMKYLQMSIGSELMPKFLGTYELELYGTIEKICQKQFLNIVNVGAGEGYYTVGLAIRNPNTNFITFEENKRAHDLIKELATFNGVLDRIKVLGFCELKDLKGCLSNTDKNLVLMDIEGGEINLLDPIMIPELQKCFMLVEIHHPVSNDHLGRTIRERFNRSHQITEIPFRGRVIEDFPITFLKRFFPKKEYIIRAMDEERQVGLRWYYFEPNSDYKKAGQEKSYEKN